MTKRFIDTNIIIYANDPRDRPKQARAIELVTEAMRKGVGVISTQVLAEYAKAAEQELHQDVDVILRQLLVLESLEVIQVTPAVIRRAVELRARYRIDFWDACILAAAEGANCNVLLSEDLSAGQLYATVKVENPFA